jgi:hypothetical protein
VTSCIVDSAPIYTMVVKFRNTIYPTPPQLSLLMKAAPSRYSNGTRPYVAERIQKAVYIVRYLCTEAVSLDHALRHSLWENIVLLWQLAHEKSEVDCVHNVETRFFCYVFDVSFTICLWFLIGKLAIAELYFPQNFILVVQKYRVHYAVGTHSTADIHKIERLFETWETCCPTSQIYFRIKSFPADHGSPRPFTLHSSKFPSHSPSPFWAGNSLRFTQLPRQFSNILRQIFCILLLLGKVKQYFPYASSLFC